MEHTKGKVEKIWQLKFGTKDKPHYLAKCKWCDISYGQHYETECPDTQVKKLAKINDDLLAACKKWEEFANACGDVVEFPLDIAMILKDAIPLTGAALIAAGDK